MLENGAIAYVTKLNFFQMYLFHNKLSFFPKSCLTQKPSLLLEHGPNKTKRDEQKLNHQRGNGVEKFMATPKQEREAFDLCGISDVTRTERRIYYTLWAWRNLLYSLFLTCEIGQYFMWINFVNKAKKVLSIDPADNSPVRRCKHNSDFI